MIALPSDRFQHVLDHFGVNRVQGGEGFVNNHQIGIMHQRGNQLGFLLHPLAEFLDLLHACIIEIEVFQVIFNLGDKNFCRSSFVQLLTNKRT